MRTALDGNGGSFARIRPPVVRTAVAAP